MSCDPAIPLDLACGSGDIGLAVWRAGGQSVSVVGLDGNRKMLRLAQRRLRVVEADRHSPADQPARPPAGLCLADMMALPIPTASMDVVTVGYGFRNAPDAAVAVAEARRVLKAGGWLFDLDFFRPESPAWCRLYLAYLWHAGRLAGRWWHDEPEAYGYIARSLERWLTAAEFGRLLAEHGFAVARWESRLGGGIALHAACRAD
jgi:demethylmenaquinone methyltransferase/2-methoxy-6-polyprenyl-1,4-benzoquinol methylase